VWKQLGQNLTGRASSDHLGVSFALSSDGRTLIAAAGNRDINGLWLPQLRAFRYDSISKLWKPLGQDMDGAATGDLLDSTHLAMTADASVVAVRTRREDLYGREANNMIFFEYSSFANRWVLHSNDPPTRKIDGRTHTVTGYRMALSTNGRTLAVLEEDFSHYNAYVFKKNEMF